MAVQGFLEGSEYGPLSSCGGRLSGCRPQVPGAQASVVVVQGLVGLLWHVDSLSWIRDGTCGPCMDTDSFTGTSPESPYCDLDSFFFFFLAQFVGL